jgi:trk system potassium uptake protein TrkH
VSAFCIAGFSNTNSGLVPLVGSEGVCYTVALLIVTGGIGFPVLEELLREVGTRLGRRRPPVRTLGTRVALRTSAVLLGVMTLAYLLLEWRASFAALPAQEKLNAAVFQAASCRTAGFNVVDVGAMHPAMLVLTCAAMFVGGSPGSTAGGIKTTTLAVLFAGLRAELLGGQPRLLNRAIPDPVIRKAIGVAFLSMTIVLAAFVLLLLVEDHPPLPLAFETVSAFSTTGLSTGITPSLSVPGKLLVTLMMFIGRIGPLTLALALAARASSARIALPEERVMIG